MKGKMTLQQRLFLPVLLLGAVMLLSNILAVISINNVNGNAGTIVNEYMVSEAKLDEIKQSMMDLHCLALSHIVAADHSTMIRLVQEIKEEEKALDGKSMGLLWTRRTPRSTPLFWTIMSSLSTLWCF